MTRFINSARNILLDTAMALIALLSGAAIVHAMVFAPCFVQKCSQVPELSEETLQQVVIQAFPPQAFPSTADAPKTKQEPKPTTPKTNLKTSQKTVPKKTFTTNPASVNLEKLSMAVAMTETANCKAKRGSALLNNCHGFKRNGKFMSFSTTAQSHAYFKDLWVRSYGGSFPTYRTAQIYSGNDHPTRWLSSVKYYYNKL